MFETLFAPIRRQFCSTEPSIEEGIFISNRVRELLELTSPTPPAADQREGDSERDLRMTKVALRLLANRSS